MDLNLQQRLRQDGYHVRADRLEAADKIDLLIKLLRDSYCYVEHCNDEALLDKIDAALSELGNLKHR